MFMVFMMFLANGNFYNYFYLFGDCLHQIGDIKLFGCGYYGLYILRLYILK